MCVCVCGVMVSPLSNSMVAIEITTTNVKKIGSGDHIIRSELLHLTSIIAQCIHWNSWHL